MTRVYAALCMLGAALPLFVLGSFVGAEGIGEAFEHYEASPRFMRRTICTIRRARETNK